MEGSLEEAEKLLASKANPQAPEISGAFSLNPDQLSALIDPKNPWVLKAIGGPDELARVLVTDLTSGIQSSQLTDSELESRINVYGENVLPEKKSHGLFKIMLMTLDDKVLIILIIAAFISLALGLYETFGEPPEYYSDGTKIPQVDWVEGVAILVAVVIVTVVGSVNDWQKERQFAKLNRKKEQRMIEVMRNGSQQQIPIQDVIVGDIIFVQPGDILAVDGVTIESNDLECDESSITGESDTMRKTSATEALNTLDATGKTKHADCLMISGAKVLQGTGRYMATSVGKNSMWGRTMLSLNEGTEVTPLQEKLNRIADGIAKFGVWAALILFIVLFIRFLVQITGDGVLSLLPGSIKGNHFMDIFIVSITIIVVAVPEGLPLAVTLALAFATTRMVKDHCLVRILKSCETMGGATSVCSDKTGTLTQNKMTVVKSLLGLQSWEFEHAAGDENEDEVPGKLDAPTSNVSQESKSPKGGSFSMEGTRFGTPAQELEEAMLQGQQKQALDDPFTALITDSLCVNSSVYEDHNDPKSLVGSKTEMALINYARTQLHVPVGGLQKYRESRSIVHVVPFDSGRKYMLSIIRLGENHYRMLVKGAAEIVLSHSNSVFDYHTANNETASKRDFAQMLVPLNGKVEQDIVQRINGYADSALRCISAAYKDFTTTHDIDWSNVRPESLDVEGLTFLGLFGIQDPLRPGVRDAVLQCQRAGVVVRMVTGDNLRTARAIAVNAHILPADETDAIVMEGPHFRELTDSQLLKIAPKICVLARSSPHDKRRLVEFLKSQGETVAVTGDGTNDAPALRLADVGFSMGISGTEVAKEASDIIIMDDNFASIVKALKWGRTVNDSVKKFLQFQLTVNVTAVTLTFISAVASSSNESVLTAVQLLWVNLIMDTLAALALATDAPTDTVLDRPPDNRKKSLITPTMWKMIFGQSIFQLAVTFVLHFAGRQIFNYPEEITPEDETRLSAMVFNTFVWMQFFNMLVNRRLDNKQNLFDGILKNPFFPIIMLIIGGFQVLIMFVGGAAFHIQRNTGAMWGTAIICGLCSIPVGMVIRLVPDRIVMLLFPRRAWNWFMICLNAIEAAFMWLMTPVTWLFGMLVLGVKRLFGIKSDEVEEGEAKADGSAAKEARTSEDHAHLITSHLHPHDDKRSLLESSNYKWVPGIEKSIAELSFLRKVRGGRSQQLNFFKRQEPSSYHVPNSRDSMHSVGSNASTLAAFMAPMVVGGAVGGWAPFPKGALASRNLD